MDCIFCKIVAGKLPSHKVYEDDDMLAFYDIAPKAKTHILFIPKQHITDATEIPNNEVLIGKIMVQIAKTAKKLGLQHYNILNNCGKEAGQIVFHLHFHLLSEQKTAN